MTCIPLLSEEQLARVQQRRHSNCPQLWNLLDTVKDPEIPVISIWDLGILQSVVEEDESIKVVITPTYSGCPAMREIESDIRAVLADAGYPSVEVCSQLSPAWTTAWLSTEGRKKLYDYGIAPPVERGSGQSIVCPQCASENTSKISEFGSTSCKALYRCHDCLEPFDYFKCI